ncbi:MAG TPA: type II toxin-antitoxin system ParD family antitoxin [Allocoleopsis sp.]
MTTLNISLPEAIQSFVEQQVAQGGYSNVSEYILHLILQEQAKAARVEALLLEGLDSGEPIAVTDEWWEQKRTQLIQGLQPIQE